MKWLRALWFLGLVCAEAWAQPSTELEVKSPDGKTHFVVVYAHDKGKSELAPGIYAVDGDSNRLILKGSVLGAGRNFNGILAHLGFGAAKGRNEVLCVVDGKLLVLHRKSKGNLADSILTLGSKAAPLVDAVTGREIELDPIQDMSNLTVVEAMYSSRTEPGGQMLIASVKQKTALGDGLTFAFLVSSVAEGTKVRLASSVQVIDYMHRTQAALTHLLPDGEKYDRLRPLVYSPSHLMAVGRPQEGDHPILAQWRERMRGLGVRFFVDDKKIKKARSEIDVPLLNVAAGKLFSQGQPLEEISSEVIPMTQSVDPVSGVSGVYFSTMDDVNLSKSPEILGRVAANTKGEAVVSVYAPSSGDWEGSAVLFIGNKYIYVTEYRGKYLIADLGSQSEVPEQITFVEKRVDETHVLALSMRTKQQAATDLIVLEKRGSNLHLKTRYTVFRRFESAVLLEERLQLDGKQIGFDNLTSADNVKTYRKSAKTTWPLLDVMQTIDMTKVVQFYRETLSERSVLGQHLVFKEYDSKGAVEDKTGVYLDAGGDSRQFVPGELLLNSTMKESGVIDSAELYIHRSENADFKVTLFGVKSKEKSKEKKSGEFTAVLLGESIWSGVRAQMKAVNIPADFERLQGAKILAGRRSRKHEVSVLFLFEEKKARAKGARAGRGGVYCQNYKIDQSVSPGEGSQVVLEATTGGWLSEDLVTPPELKRRLVADSAGGIYFIETPNRTQDDRFYVVRQLAKPEVAVRPATMAEPLHLRADEVLSEDLENFQGIYSRWNIFGRYDLEKCFSWLPKHLTKMEQAVACGKSDPAAKLFPELDAYLEALAQPGSPRDKTVLLVEPELKEQVWAYLLSRLAFNEEGYWSLRSNLARNVHFYIFDPSATEEEITREMKKMSTLGGDRRPVLLADVRDVAQAKALSEKTSEGGRPGLSAAEEEGAEEEGLEEELEEEPERPRKGQVSENQPQESEAEEAESRGGVLPTAGESKGKSVKIEDALAIPQRRPNQLSPLCVIATEGTCKTLKAFRPGALGLSRVPALLLATPTEWREIQRKHPAEVKAGGFSQLSVDSRFLTSSWTVWPAQSDRASNELKELDRLPVSADELRVFEGLELMLRNMASQPGSEFRHRVLIVPDSLKPIVQRMILGLWATENRQLEGPWNQKNHHLSLFRVSTPTQGPLTQEGVVDNFQAMKGLRNAGKHPVLLGDLEVISKTGAPAPMEGHRPIVLTDAAAKPSSAIMEAGAPAVVNQRFPHLLWLLATEGKAFTPTQLAKGLSGVDNPEVPMLLVGSESEWNKITQQDTPFEGRFGLAEHFEITRLAAPSDQVKLDLLARLFSLPEIRRLEYRFQLDQNDTESSQRQLLALLVRRVAEIARDLNHEPTTAFIRAYSGLRRSLAEDTSLRTKKILDRPYFERLLATVFPIPLSPEILPETDPLRRLKDPDQSALALQESGLEGPVELKSRVVRGILGQTRATDEGRPIPASFILFGGTSTGKTFLFKTLALKHLGLKLYDFDRHQSEEAGAIIVPVASLTEERDPAHPDLIPVDDMLAHLSNMLALPNGHRAWILIDDLHKARSTIVLRKVMGFLQALLDTPKGLKAVRRIGQSEVREIPVRNLSVFITVNPTPDRELLERFVGDETGEGTLINRLIAALARPDYQIEDSVFARFGNIIDMDKFPRSAKSGALISRIQKATQTDYSSRSRLVLVSPDVVQGVVDAFPDAHAREFLSTATNALVDIKPELPPAPLYLVLPSADQASETDVSEHSNKIEEHVRRHTVVRPVVPGSVEGTLDLTSFLVDGFRNALYTGLVVEGQQTATLAGNLERRVNYLGPFIWATMSHIQSRRTVPLSLLAFSLSELGLSGPSGIKEFKATLEAREGRRKEPFFPVSYSVEVDPNQMDLDTFLGRRLPKPVARARAHVMEETVTKLESVLGKMLAEYFRVSSSGAFPAPGEWIAGLEGPARPSVMKENWQSVFRIYTEFLRNIVDPELIESLHKHHVGGEAPGAPSLTGYDMSRLFLVALDKAIVRLPWGSATAFSMNLLRTASSDLAMGQQGGLHRFLFDTQFSPFQTHTLDRLFQTTVNDGGYKEMGAEARERLENDFNSNCSRFLMGSIK